MSARPSLNLGDLQPTGGVKRNRRGAAVDPTLLGFTTTNRPTQPAPTPRRGNNRTRASHVENVMQSRERFLHAQYRFLVKPSGDYTVHFCDPDIHFAWHDVLQVIVPTSSGLPSTATPEAPNNVDAIECPICLSPPSAARMSRCGHIACFACLLRYFALTDAHEGAGTWRKCPVCTEPIHPRDLKSVKWSDPLTAVLSIDVPLTDPTLVAFRLMVRPKLTTLALPRSSTWPSDHVPANAAPWAFTPDAPAYARFMLADPDDMLASLRSDLRELETEEHVLRAFGPEGDGALGMLFVDTARTKVREQMVKAEALKTPAVLAARTRAVRSVADAQAESDYAANNARASSSSSEDLSYGLAGLSIAQTRARRNVNPPAPTDASQYFYQAASGQNIFLSPLDMKVLRAHYGDDGMPAIIQVRIEAVETSVVTDELRKRCRYLAHLPARTDVTLVESELETSGLVPASGLESFLPALKQRRQKRRERARREDRALERGSRRTEPTQPYVAPDGPLVTQEFTTWVSDMPALPSSDKPTTDAAADGPRTVWNTRARPPAVLPLRVSQVHDENDGYSDERELDDRWDAFAAAATQARERAEADRLERAVTASGGAATAAASSPAPASGRKGKKNRIVLSLGGGGGPGTRR